MLTSDMALVGQRVKSLRELRGISVGGASGKSGVSVLDISELEAGRGIDDVTKLGRIAKALDGSCDEILAE